MHKINQAFCQTIIGLITLYRWLLSPLLGNCCRFYPSCSQYAQTALRRFGIVVGLYLLVRRLLRCHPLHSGGFDPVPDRLK
ncbi:MAG: membrane protein insertion efficiency factor YidD [Gammaproteobacteria bacterium]|nr:membrane protein insertion efficiency factor YidD [Gammaproteobacteria bacterium]